MAVCGYCWICGGKFECRELESCGSCTEHKPLRTYRDGIWEHRICGHCELAITSGVVGALFTALRAAAERVAEHYDKAGAPHPYTGVKK